MSVVVRKYKRGGWMVDVRLRMPDGTMHRDRRVFRTASKTAADRWGQDRERTLLLDGPPKPKKEVPTLAEFAPRFMDGHARANQHKPSGIASKEVLLRVHLVPFLGHKRLDTISNEDVQQLKASLSCKSPKTVNNVLTVLSVLLKKAEEWGVVERIPCVIRLLKTVKSSADFHDFEQYERLVGAARADGPVTELAVLLGGEGGLRCGEMMALEWRDVNFANRQLCVERSDWDGEVTAPKGGRLRHIPLTSRLWSALREHRHLKSARVLCNDDGSPLTRQQVQYRVKRAARTVNVGDGVHILRHTFCSHLTMFGAPAGAIQLLAGHSDISVTQRYTHLSPASLDAAMRLLDGRGNMLATQVAAMAER